MKTGKIALTEKVHTVFSASRPEISVAGVTAQPGRTQLVLSSVSNEESLWRSTTYYDMFALHFIFAVMIGFLCAVLA